MANAPRTLADPPLSQHSDQPQDAQHDPLLEASLPQQPQHEQQAPDVPAKKKVSMNLNLHAQDCSSNGEQGQDEPNSRNNSRHNAMQKRTMTVPIDELIRAKRSDSSLSDDESPQPRSSLSPTKTSIDDFITHQESRRFAENQMRPLQAVIQSDSFNVGATALITLNAIYIGIETDQNLDVSNSKFWLFCDCIFATLFSIELAVRMLGLRLNFFRDGWNLFDMTLVPIMLVDVIVNGIIAAQQSEGGNDDLGVFSVMRILRALRLARILRLLRFFKELWLLVSGFINSLRTLAWAWFLIVVILYVFGILVTRTLGQPYGCEVGSNPNCDPEMDVYFGTIAKSMLSLFQMITTDYWAYISRQSMKQIPSMWIVFVIFMSMTTFAVMNVIVAVILENTLRQAALRRNDLTKKLDKDREFALKKIYEVFRIADIDGDGVVVREEFMSALNNPEVMANLESVEIDMRCAEGLFDILDYDESGSLDVTEFIEGCMRARGSAKAKDVLAMQCDLWRTQEGVRHDLQKMQDMMNTRFQRCLESCEPLRLHLQSEAFERERTGSAPLTHRSQLSTNHSARSQPSETEIAPAPPLVRFQSKNRESAIKSKKTHETLASSTPRENRERELPGAAAAT